MTFVCKKTIVVVDVFVPIHSPINIETNRSISHISTVSGVIMKRVNPVSSWLLQYRRTPLRHSATDFSFSSSSSFDFFQGILYYILAIQMSSKKTLRLQRDKQHSSTHHKSIQSSHYLLEFLKDDHFLHLLKLKIFWFKS